MRKACRGEHSGAKLMEKRSDDGKEPAVALATAGSNLDIAPTLKVRRSTDYFCQMGDFTAMASGKTVYGSPPCHCTKTISAPTRRPLSSNFMTPPPPGKN